VYPFGIQLGPIEITGFGIMVMLGFFIAGWVMQERLRELGRSDHYAWDIIVAGVIGGLLGAKLWYVALYGDPGALFHRAGLVWYGGLLGGAAAVLLNGRWRRVPMRFTLDLAAPGLAVGYALGRVGCFLVQDDYGIPTSLPWGMKFPHGLPASTAQNLAAWGVEVPPDASPFDVLAVHPTQLYETAIMLFVFWLLWRLRAHPRGTGWLFGLYLMLAGTERFLVEFIRAKDDRFFGALSLAQLTALAVVAIGAMLAAAFQSKPVVAVERVEALKPPAAPGKR
jgi:phosphatidylglycerol:prolipoprotein diacylglycerol transferase